MAIRRYQGNTDMLIEILSNCWYGMLTADGYGPGDQKDWDYCKKCEYCRDGELCISHLLVNIEDYIKDQRDEIESLNRQIKSVRKGFFAKLLTAKELMAFTENGKRYFCYVEHKGDSGVGYFDEIRQDVITCNKDGSVEDVFFENRRGWFALKSYGKNVRCWTFEPTSFQIKNTPWEAKSCE